MRTSWPTVLHVEDNLGDKELLEHASQAAQIRWNLQWVEDGQAAVDYLCGCGPYADREKFPLPGLVLLDLKMPRKNGFEVLEWLRQKAHFKCIPVVIFTASDSAKDARRALELGANSFLVKPTSYRDLIEYARGVYQYWFELNEVPEH